jgi:hypothetical protein
MAAFAAGGCLCGAVRYECAAPPVMSGACHCRDCQRNSGSAFATLMIFKKDAVAVSGDALASFTHKGDSGKSVSRHFCRQCGSPVFAEYAVTPDFRVIMAGTLDDPALIAPQWNIYTASKQPWVALPPHMKAFEGGFRRE